MKTPDEIKKDLQHCSQRTQLHCLDCSHDGESFCTHKLTADALAYIQQLERERDALLADLSNCDGNCHFCDWFGDTGCVAPNDGKQPKHTHDCPFKWRGVKEDA